MGTQASCLQGPCQPMGAGQGSCCNSSAPDPQVVKAVLNWQLIQAVMQNNIETAKIAIREGAELDACKQSIVLRPVGPGEGEEYAFFL